MHTYIQKTKEKKKTKKKLSSRTKCASAPLETDLSVPFLNFVQPRQSSFVCVWVGGWVGERDRERERERVFIYCYISSSILMLPA